MGLNEIRRRLAEKLDDTPVLAKALLNRRLSEVTPLPFPTDSVTYKQNISNSLSEKIYHNSKVSSTPRAYELTHINGAELMRTRYCIRYELGMCPVYQGAKGGASLFLLNNGRRLALEFDCRNCEMIICEDSVK